MNDADALDWRVVLDLGTDTRATDLDVLCLQATLQASGIDACVYPWGPSEDVFTPLGAVRPTQLLVRASDFGDASELAAHILDGNPIRHEVLVPVADAWICERWISVIVGHMYQRAEEHGGLWTALWTIFRVYVVVTLGFALIGMLSSLWAALPWPGR